MNLLDARRVERLMNRLATFSLLFLALCLFACGGGGTRMTEFSSADGKFKVLFPGTPHKKTQERGGKIFTLLEVNQSNGAYVVVYGDLPKAPDPEDTLPDEVRGFVEAYGGTVKSQTKINLKGVPGLDVVGTATKPKSGDFRARFYLAKARLYRTVVIGTPQWVDSDASTKFLNSFEILP